MFKKIFIIIFILFLALPSFAWRKKKEEAKLILTSFNPEIETNYDEILKEHSVFKTNQRIYFIVSNHKADYIKYQIVKQDDKAHVGGYTRYRTNTTRTQGKDPYYNYFTLGEAGKYYLQIFDIKNLNHWLAIGGFRVENE